MSASIVQADTVEGASLQINSEGVNLSRRFIVSVTEGDASLRLFLAATAEGIPARGNSHPTISGVRVDTISPRALDNENFEVIVTYKVFLGGKDEPPAPDAKPQISVGASVSEVETSYDKDGNLITIPYVSTDKDETTGIPLITDNDPGQTGTVKFQNPVMILRFTRKELESPEDKSADFTGCVNVSSWRGYDARTWLCSRIEGQSDDGGATFNVSYEFQYNRNTWDATAVWINPETGAPAKDIDENTKNGNGIVTKEILPTADFGQLNLGV